VLDVVSNLDLFDLGKPWDLEIYVKSVERALDEKLGDSNALSVHLTKVVDATPAIDSGDNNSLYNAIYALTEKHSGLMSNDLATALAGRTLDYLGLGFDEDYPHFRKCLSHLSPQGRIACIRQLENRCFRDVSDDRTELLANVTADVCSDPDVRGNGPLVRELFDFAFRAATDYPGAATEPLLKLSEWLKVDDRVDYLDRALDRLVYLQSGDQGIDEMEPFLRLLEKFKQEVQSEAEQKLTRFLERMLSPASDKQRKLRAIQLLKGLQLPRLVHAVESEIQAVAQLEDVDLAAKAAELLNS